MGERMPLSSELEASAWDSFHLNADSTLPASCRRWLGNNIGQALLPHRASCMAASLAAFASPLASFTAVAPDQMRP
jgi:hypothetical protein